MTITVSVNYGTTIGKPKRRSRAKRNLAWERIEIESNGYYARSLTDLAARFPTLTPTELRICALVKGSFLNWEIAEKLNVCENTVENHRVNIRRKLRLRSSQSLLSYLLIQ